MAGHAQLKFVMTECSKTQIRLTRHTYSRDVAHMIKMNIRFINARETVVLRVRFSA